jgi:hypothetical protein
VTSLSVDDLLLGGTATHRVTVPSRLVDPSVGGSGSGEEPEASTVTIRPLVMADVQRVAKAAQESSALTSVLMVQQAMVDPALTIDEVQRMPAGLVEFLVGEVNRVSGLTIGSDTLSDAVQAPLARACFVLARQFGWTPEQCSALTVGQVLLYLEMVGRGEHP